MWLGAALSTSQSKWHHQFSASVPQCLVGVRIFAQSPAALHLLDGAIRRWSDAEHLAMGRLLFFFSEHEIEHNNTEMQCLLASKQTRVALHYRKLAKSRSTSWSCGVSPSAPDAPGSSNNVLANARAAVHDNKEPHLKRHACSALRCSSLHSPLALAVPANSRTFVSRVPTCHRLQLP